MKKNIQLVKLPSKKFEDVKQCISENSGYINMDEKIAFTCMWGDVSWIAINEETWEDLDDDEQKIVISHETAHATGIESEEKADRWALDVLNPKQKIMLIDMWEVRHGHTFESNT